MFKNLAKLFKNDKKAAVVRLKGAIGEKYKLNAEKLLPTLTKAFEQRNLQCVCLVINSPGGSASQSYLIAEQVRRLSVKHKTPVYTFIEDIGASGGYFLAVSGDEIYADPFAVVGSVGVIMQNFGLVDLIGKLGIESRLSTAGKNKALGNPFAPMSEDTRARFKTVLDDMHVNFKDYIKQRRGNKIKSPEDDIFEGDVYTPSEAVKHGLIDGIGDYQSVIRKKYGEDIEFKQIKTLMPWRFSSFDGIIAQITNSVISTLEERITASKFY